MNNNSIYNRLILRLIIPMILINILIFALVYLLFGQKVNTFFDHNLLAAAKSIKEKTLVEYDKLIVNLPYFSIDMLENNNKGHAFYSVQNEDGKIIAGFKNIPDPLNKEKEIQFYYANYYDKEVRVIYLKTQILQKDSIYNATIKLAVTLDNREEVLREILLLVIFISLIIIITATVISKWGVKNALSPLYSLQKTLQSRDAHDLNPIHAKVPNEVQIMIDGINALLQRIKGNISYMERFNADVSHQLRTPLAELKAFVQLNDKKVDKNYYKKIKLIDSMVHTVNQLLFYAKTNPGAFNKEHFRTVNLVSLCQDIFEKIVPTIYDNNFEFEFIYSRKEININCDVILIEALVSNVINNSLKYAKNALGEDLITFEIKESKDCVYLIMKDKGEGIEEIHHKNVFERFVRLDCNTQGTGLGLNIVAQIVELHKAKVSLENTENEFCVIIEFKKEELFNT